MVWYGIDFRPVDLAKSLYLHEPPVGHGDVLSCIYRKHFLRQLATTVASSYIAHPPFDRSTCYYRRLDTYSSWPSVVRVFLSCLSAPHPCSSAPVLSSSPYLVRGRQLPCTLSKNLVGENLKLEQVVVVA